MKKKLWDKIKLIRIIDVLNIFLFIIALPFSFFYKIFRKDLWLICEYDMYARDNAFYLFEYLCINRPEVDAVYAINYNSPDYKKVSELGNTVKYGSLKHWVLYLSAHVNISSQKGGKPNAAICYILEILGLLKNNRVFLQHGIIKDDLPFLHYDNAKIGLFVCSAEREYNFVCENFGYEKEAIVKTGLCRYDKLIPVDTKERIVAILPTWREWIAKGNFYEMEFRKTNYFIMWNELLNHDCFINYVKENNLKLVFCQHREMNKFNSYFDIDEKIVNHIKFDSEEIEDIILRSELLITDYGSIAFDFAYMKKSVIYYQPDYLEFREKHLPKGYYNYKKDGFGPVCVNLCGLFSEIVKWNEDETWKFVYEDRIKNFFDFNDNKNCERNFYAIINKYGNVENNKIKDAIPVLKNRFAGEKINA